jgi:SH3 domain protein
MKQWFKLLGIAAPLLLVSLSVRAEIAYVSEGVKLGVHQEAALSSTILTLVAAGTALEVLEQKNGLVKVRFGGGTEGWVDGRYLSKNITPGQKADGLEAELVQTSTELAKARELAAELEYQLNRERERAKIMEADLLKAREELEKKPSNKSNSAADSADALRKLRKASEENERLNKRILELETKLQSAGSDPGKKSVATVKPDSLHRDDASLLSRYTAITEWQPWQIMLLFFGLLLAFAVGGYLVDWEVRRRHGGFRV